MIRNLNLLGWLEVSYSDDLAVPEHMRVDELDLHDA